MKKVIWTELLQNALLGVNQIPPDDVFDFFDQGNDFDPINVRQSKPPRRAAVLVPLVWRGDVLKVVLTQRTEHLPTHAGQIAFPGGSFDKSDVDLAQTALREAKEEIGLDPEKAQIIGACDNYYTRSNFLITPIVAFLDENASFSPDEYEVDKIFELPFEFLIDQANQKVHSRVFNGIERFYCAIECEGYYVWGVTASLFKGLGKRLSLTESAIR